MKPPGITNNHTEKTSRDKSAVQQKMLSFLFSPHIIILFAVIGQRICLRLWMKQVKVVFYRTVDVDGTVEK